MILNGQRSLARTYVGALRKEAELQEGRRRLRIATEFKARKTAQGEEAARLSLLLTDHAQQENHGLADFRTDLADLARIVELFNAEENVDTLVDLKDNLLRPALARITYQFDLIQDLKLALFGKGYTDDEAHQRILAGVGGLYSLRREPFYCDASAENSRMTWRWFGVRSMPLLWRLGKQRRLILGRSQFKWSRSWPRTGSECWFSGWAVWLCFGSSPG
jgi:hypothetical protein